MAIVVDFLLQFLVAIYGGYFGAGMSIVVLAMLSRPGYGGYPCHECAEIGVGVAVNGIAGFYFVFSGAVYWPQAGIMTLGACRAATLAHISRSGCRSPG